MDFKIGRLVRKEGWCHEVIMKNEKMCHLHLDPGYRSMGKTATT